MVLCKPAMMKMMMTIMMIISNHAYTQWVSSAYQLFIVTHNINRVERTNLQMVRYVVMVLSM